MSSRRVLKAAQAIREVVSMAIITDIKDPRVRDVTVTFVEVSGDMRQARVNVSIMGDEKKQKLCLRGLQSSTGFLQQKIGRRLEFRYTPRLQFALDQGVKNAMIVTKILDEVLPSDKPEAMEATYEPEDASASPEASSPEASSPSREENETS